MKQDYIVTMLIVTPLQPRPYTIEVEVHAYDEQEAEDRAIAHAVRYEKAWREEITVRRVARKAVAA